jgi:hypothetical protein
VLSGEGPKWSGHNQIFFFGPLAMPLVRLRHTNRDFLPSIPSPPLCFYSSFFTKKKNPFSLEFSQSYQSTRLNFMDLYDKIILLLFFAVEHFTVMDV